MFVQVQVQVTFNTGVQKKYKKFKNGIKSNKAVETEQWVGHSNHSQEGNK